MGQLMMEKDQTVIMSAKADKWTPEVVAAEILHEMVNHAKIPFEFIEERITEALFNAKKLEDKGEEIWIAELIEALPQEAYGILEFLNERMQMLLKNIELSSFAALTNESHMYFFLDYSANNRYEASENHKKFPREEQQYTSYKLVKDDGFYREPFKSNNKEEGSAKDYTIKNPRKKERINMEIVPISSLEPINTA